MWDTLAGKLLGADPGEAAPETFQGPAFVLIGPEFEEPVLEYDHSDAHQRGPCGAQGVVHAQAPLVEDETAQDGLQQVVGEAHSAKESKFSEHFFEPVKPVPKQHGHRKNEYQDGQIPHGMDQVVKLAEFGKCADDYQYGRYHQQHTPSLEVAALVVASGGQTADPDRTSPASG